LVEVALIVGVCFAYMGQAAPNVNETHYLAKAKHFWNPDWCSQDIFLSSSTPHYLFYATFGWLTIFFKLPTVAWIGRILCWVLFAFSWRSLSFTVMPRNWISVVTATLFLFLCDQCHLAGEWVIGGVESKSFAFPLVFWAIACILRSQWNRVWLLLGLASSFHVLVGGWTCLAAMCSFLLGKATQSHSKTWRSQIVPLVVGGTISLLGVLPPILANGSADADTIHQANLIMVTQRLSHHQWFKDFSTARVAWFAAMLFVWALLDRFVKAPKWTAPLRHLAVVSLAISWVGMGLSSHLEANSSSRAADLLIFYWFRLSDFMLPLVTTFTLVLMLAHERLKGVGIAGGILMTCFFGSVCVDNWSDPRPIAVQSSLYAYPGQPKRTWETYQNWKAACEWIRQNTPKDSVFLTPAEQQTFKWYAERAEAVCWKDVPQDAATVLQWYERVQRLYRVELSYREGLWAYTDQQLLDLGEDLGATHLMTLQSHLDWRAELPSGLRQVYPTDPSTKTTFVIFELNSP
jgi:hypothetical protein